MNKYFYQLSAGSSVTVIEASNITEADAKYKELTGLTPQKTSVTIEFEGKVWKDGKYQPSH